MTFTKPVIGPKVYLSRGPSGHSETFKREQADQALKTLLGQITLKIAIEGYVGKKNRDRSPDSWPDIISYLGALLSIHPDKLPLDVAVAFWAQVDLEREAKKRAERAEALVGN